MIDNDAGNYWSKLVFFTALALLPVVGLFLLLLAVNIRGQGAYLVAIFGGLLIIALPIGKFMLFPTTTLEHMYRGWILRRIRR